MLKKQISSMESRYNNVLKENQFLWKTFMNSKKQQDEMKRQYKLLEDELEQRRNEVFQLKRANNAQYVMEERENWRAMVTQQKQEIEKLKKGSNELPA